VKLNFCETMSGRATTNCLWKEYNEGARAMDDGV